MDYKKIKYFKEYEVRKKKAREFYAQVNKGYFREENIITVVQNYVYEVELESYSNRLMGLDK